MKNRLFLTSVPLGHYSDPAYNLKVRSRTSGINPAMKGGNNLFLLRANSHMPTGIFLYMRARPATIREDVGAILEGVSTGRARFFCACYNRLKNSRRITMQNTYPRFPLMDAIDDLNNVNNKLDFIQLAVSTIIETNVSSETACGVSLILWDISAQIKKIERIISNHMKGVEDDR
jgi:hypothetical protein